MEHPTKTADTKGKADRPDPPPDNPGSPGQASRARSRELARQQPEETGPPGEEKPTAGEPKDKPTAGTAEQDEATDSPTPAKPKHTLPSDNPGSPSQPSRLESLARAREPVQPEYERPEPEAKDAGAQPTEGRRSEAKEQEAGKLTAEDGRPAAGEKPEASGEPAPSNGKYTLPSDNPGSPSQPSRLESLARAREPVQPEYERPEPEAKDGAEPTAEDAKRATGEQPEASDEPALSEQKYTLPVDSPGSPSQPSRLESLARAREPVRQETRTKETEVTSSDRGPAGDSSAAQRWGSGAEEAPTRDYGLPADGVTSTDAPADHDQRAGQSANEQATASASQTERSVDEKLDSLTSRDDQEFDVDAPAVPTHEPDLPEAISSPDDFERRIPGDGPPDDNGRALDFDEDVLERGIADRLRQIVAKVDRNDAPKELTDTVDRPDFQDPEEDPGYVPDRYGSILGGADGNRIPLFKGQPTREQTEQGALGDCGVIATLGAVAGCYPEAIRDRVREADDGNYEVNFYEAKYSTSRQRYEPTGRMIRLKVTPELPVKDREPNIPAFARLTSANVAWAPVLEKAIAGMDQTWSAARRDKADRLWRARKRSGDAPTGYVRLNQGTSPGERAELLTQLTGRPAKTVQFPSGYDNKGRSADRRLHDEIAGQLSQGNPVLVGTRELNKGETRLPRRLAECHAYEVIRIDNKGMVHLRNPWNDTHPAPMTIREFRANIRPRYTTTD